VLNTIWAAIGPNLTAYYPTEPIYILTDNNTGENFRLDLDEELTRKEGGPLKLNRKQVHITGDLNPAIGSVDLFGNIVAPPAANLVTVRTIDVADEETPPVGSSHLLGAHISGSQRW
jgi:hypothetical protein